MSRFGPMQADVPAEQRDAIERVEDAYDQACDDGNAPDADHLEAWLAARLTAEGLDGEAGAMARFAILMRFVEAEGLRREAAHRLFPGLSDVVSAVFQYRDATATTAASRVGDFRLAGFEILQHLRSGQADVYVAAQERPRRRVAIKVIPGRGVAGHAAHQRFDREVRLLARMRHPGIVALHQADVTEQYSWFVMEYVDGQPFDAWAREQDREPASILQAMIQVCAAVDHAHGQGVIHRDLKPSNVLVDRDDHPRVLDLGLARIKDDLGTSSPLSVSGQFLGTVRWASPEQAGGAVTSVDERSDVFSLGVILYEALTGAFPVRLTGHLSHDLRRLQSFEPTPPRRHRPDLAPDLETILLRALAVDRTERYASVAAFGGDLQSFLDGGPIQARPDSGARRAKRWLGRHRSRLAVVGALLCAVLIGAAGVHRYDRALRASTFALLSAHEFQETEDWQPNEAWHAAVRRAWNWARRGRLSASEVRTLCDATTRVEVHTRDIVLGEGHPPDSLNPMVYATTPAGFGLAYEVSLALDDQPLELINRQAQPLRTAGTGVGHGALRSGLGTQFRVPPLAPGRHELRGHVGFTLVGARDSDRLPVPSVTVPISPISFSVYTERPRVPSDHPPIVESYYVAEFARGFRVDTVALEMVTGIGVFLEEDPEGGDVRIWGRTDERDRNDAEQYRMRPDWLTLEVAMPVPPEPVAFAVQLRHPETGFETTFRLVARPPDHKSPTHRARVAFDREGLWEQHRAEWTGDAYRIRFRRLWLEIAPWLAPSDVAGQALDIRVVPSRPAARREQLERIPGVHARRQQVLAESRPPERIRASDLVYDLLGRMTPLEAYGQVRAAALDEPVRRLALQILNARFRYHGSLIAPVWHLARYGARHPEQYRVARDTIPLARAMEAKRLSAWPDRYVDDPESEDRLLHALILTRECALEHAFELLTSLRPCAQVLAGERRADQVTVAWVFWFARAGWADEAFLAIDRHQLDTDGRLVQEALAVLPARP